MRPDARPSPVRVLALSLALAALTALSTACRLEFDGGVEARGEWRRTYTLAPGGAFEIQETNGRISVTGTDGDQVEVVAAKVAKAPTEEGAKAVLDEMTIAETVSDTAIQLDSTTRGLNLTLGSGVSRRIDYTVKVPRGTRVTLRSTNGNIEVTALDAALSIRTSNGRITGTGLGGGASVVTTNGVISLEATAVARGISCETTNGLIEVTIPADAKADVSLRTTNGGISTDGLDVSVVEQSRRRLDGAINGGGPEIRLQTTNGAVRLRGR